MSTITITTPANRKVRISLEAARTLEAVGNPGQILDAGIDRGRAELATRVSRTVDEFRSRLLDDCLDAAETDDVIAGWTEYVEVVTDWLR